MKAIESFGTDCHVRVQGHSTYCIRVELDQPGECLRISVADMDNQGAKGDFSEVGTANANGIVLRGDLLKEVRTFIVAQALPDTFDILAELVNPILATVSKEIDALAGKGTKATWKPKKMVTVH